MADENENPRIQFRLTDDLAGWLAGREERMSQPRNHNRQVTAEIGMWRTVLDAELRRIRLTLAQANCVADVCNGFMLDATVGTTPGLVYAECYDAFRFARERGGDISSYGAKWGPEGCDPAKWEQDLLDYLGRLGPGADHALRDAIARWWRIGDVEYGDAMPTPEQARGDEIEQFAAVGLRVTE